MLRALLSLFLVCFAASLVPAAQAACAAGDLACACKEAGGKWRDLKSPLMPVCTIGVKHQGKCTDPAAADSCIQDKLTQGDVPRDRDIPGLEHAALPTRACSGVALAG